MRLIALLVLGGFCVSAAAADATWADLREGTPVVLVRHGTTSGGAGDPKGFRLEDCATQRNLTDKGRAQARRLGERFRAEGIKVGKVLSSQWCRCRDTASLMDLGPIEIAPTFNNAFALRERREELREGARAVIAAWRGPGVLVVVTHGSNIAGLTGIMPDEGGMVAVAPDPASAEQFRVIGRIPPGS